MTSQKQISLFTEEQSTSLVVASLANPTQVQESDLAKKMRDISGRKCLEQFGKFNRVGLWARTFADLLIGTGDWYSTRCKLSWKLKATKSSRFYFQLVPLTHHTEETAFGLLPTPTASDNPEKNTGKMKQDGLQKRARTGLLPTPTCMDSSKNGDMTGAAKLLMGATTRSSGQQIQRTLTDAVQMEILKENPALAMELASKEFMKRTKLPTQIEFVEWIKTIGTQKELSEKLNLKLTKVEHWFRKDKIGFSYPSIEDWTLIKSHYQVPMELDNKMSYQESIEWKGLLPTPTLQEYTNSTLPPSQIKRNNIAGVLLRKGVSAHSQLNPLFVEEMMGFPKNWTTLPFQNGETKASKPTGTQ
jgi:hypothetical protein